MTWMNDSHNQNQIRSPKIQECFILIFGIGVSCSREFARERMNMSDVVNELHSTKEKLLGTRIHQENIYLQVNFLSHSSSTDVVMNPPTPSDEYLFNSYKLK